MSTLKSGIVTEWVDETVKPGDDFFRHVNGRWLDTYEIPADRSKDGGLYTLRDDAEKHVREIIERIAVEDPSSRIGALYSSFMNTEKIEEDRLAPLDKEVAPILAAPTPTALALTLALMSRSGIAQLIGWYTSIDAKNPENYTFFISQSGLGLPDEAYYREEKYEQICQAYIEFVAKMFAATGYAEPFGLSPEEAAQIIFAHESEIASAHWDVVRNRDAEAKYNPYTPAELEEKFPGFPYELWLASLGTDPEKLGKIIVSQPSFFEAVGTMWTNTPLMTWKLWALWCALRSRAPFLHEEISSLNFEFYGKTLSGTQEQRERWKRGVAAVENALDQELGKEYVAVHFPPSDKEKMLKLVNHLLQAYRNSIQTLDWMTEETRTKALEKLSKFVTKIGYPDQWRDYSGLSLDPNDLFENLRRTAAFDSDFMIERNGKPVDKTEWLMSPQTVNAYYMPPANEIVFPAAILRPPFFDPEADDAANYGGIGMVIGHEIGHGFDDKGSLYDGDGALNNWWTEEDHEEFTKRTQKLVEQYNSYTPAQLDPEKFHVNGELTLGENIGDLSGLSIALAAYELALAEEGLTLETAPVLDGKTALQRFFWSTAQGWRTKSRPQHEELMISVDPHSPDEFRVNGIVRNIDAFYDAFEVAEGDKLYLAPEDRVRIWQ
ncbi:MAG: M13-type metalloendopeptidase [Rothia sp. (in: high G+C Gram-positive bacteria)]|uniref:M13 family metallopeptidase n=1 Tax=Rothia sp. (in: high G+C Gram-positive bacteria) TaxID=1885016 RepID=UPI0026E0DA81|nr:M13-type metalloendopeptidase [Rothia sp. (in: high G+C Gram-positive bacteria)]MDO5750452.1 M13-type metalloendopeptidase [Rothia sp. (in: high G+C Gram-positive bacteria)]